MIEYQDFTGNAEELGERVARAAEKSGRNVSDIRILPVTKTFPVTAVEYCLRYGYASVGENRVQEVIEKQGEYRSRIRWELIGHLQSNKVRAAVECFDSIQSVDSTKLMAKLQRVAAEMNRDLDVLLQFNTGEDPNKYGLDVGVADAAVEQLLKCDRLKLRGLMTIAPLSDDPGVARRAFSRLRELKERLSCQFGISLPELSMGMTGDLELAIMEGSTCVRVGTALFGAREKQT